MVQGRGVNASLNENGKLQAIKMYNHLKSIPFDQLYASSLVRTEETVIDFVNSGLPIIPHSGFDEISWGDQEGVKATVKEKAVYADTLEEWRNGNLDLSVGGGESPMQVVERQKEAMDIVLNSEHETILICMHGRAMRILLCWLLNYPLNFMDGFPHQNCAYYQLSVTNQLFSILKFNAVDHLNG